MEPNYFLLSLICVAVIAGGLAVYSAMRLLQYFKNLSGRITDLEEQIKGKTLPYYVSRFLEDHIALEDMQDDDLSVLVLLHQRMGNLLDSALTKKNKDMELARAMRSGNYGMEGKKKS
jgi:hypothetical protein